MQKYRKKHSIDWKETGTLAFCIALFPPLWAVLAAGLSVRTGAVALICAGLYVTNGNKKESAVSISLGFLLGDLWAVAALYIMNILPWNENINLFLTLFVMGGMEVILSALSGGWIFCPAWLCGWAIGLTVMSPAGAGNLGTYPLEIAVAMLAGVWYVGVFLDFMQKKMRKVLDERRNG